MVYFFTRDLHVEKESEKVGSTRIHSFVVTLDNTHWYYFYFYALFANQIRSSMKWQSQLFTFY